MWNCPSCTLKNNSHILLCVLCNSPKPVPTINYPNLSSPELRSMTHTNASPNEAANNKSIAKHRKKSWKRVSSQSSYLQFEYNHHNNKKNNNKNSNNNNNSNMNDNNNNYIYEYNGFDFDDNINIQQINKQVKLLSSAMVATTTSPKYNRNKRKRFNKYSITDIFACNSSFILDHKYSNSDICNLILNNSTQTQTKLKFLKLIWPHILRVTTRVLNGSKFRCPICLDENIDIGRITICGHCFCGMCLIHHLYTKQKHYNQVDDNYNFTDLFGHCPLCNEYVSFEQCRPLTVIRVDNYKANDLINIVLIRRQKGQQPSFTSGYKQDHNLDISTFKKFETETNEIEKCNYEINHITKLIKSSDPIYEKPFLYLLLIQIKQYKMYIQKQLLNQNDNKENFTNDILNNGTTQYRKTKYVYQSCDGQLIFLHPHNYNMLKHFVNYNFNLLPSYLSNLKILQIDQFIQSYDLRRKYPFLAFIPVDVKFLFIEVDLNNILNTNTINYFKKQSFDREQYRIQNRLLHEQELKQKEIMEEERIKLQKKKYGPKPAINLNDYNEFPLLSTPSKSNNENTNSSNSDNDKLSDNSPVISRTSPAHGSWSQITINKKAFGMESSNIQTFVTPTTKCYSNSGNSNSNSNSKKKKKRRRGRNKKKNKNKV